MTPSIHEDVTALSIHLEWLGRELQRLRLARADLDRLVEELEERVRSMHQEQARIIETIRMMSGDEAARSPSNIFDDDLGVDEAEESASPPFEEANVGGSVRGGQGHVAP